MSIRSSYELTRLFLALSDVTRQKLLNQLSEPMSVIDVCTTFDILVHEAARQLRRLEDVGLLRQLPNGEYVISLYGRTISSLVEDIGNIHDLLEYWEGHTAAELPAHLHCLPAQLNDLFLRDAELYKAIHEALDESSGFLWVLNYSIGRSHESVGGLKILTRSGIGADSYTRVVEDVFSSAIINEHRAFIFFPGVKNEDEYYNDLTNGFMISEPNPTYRLIVEFFKFLWDERAQLPTKRPYYVSEK